MTVGPSMIDLFAGCGGMTVGFAAEGSAPKLAVEWDLFAAATYAANFGEAHTYLRRHRRGQRTTRSPSRRRHRRAAVPGVLQPGQQGRRRPRNKLWKQYLRFVQVARPQVFVLENV